MKTNFLTVCSIIFFACSGLINAQVDTVKLKYNKANVVEDASWELVVSPGDSIIFVSIGGDFAIFIPNAIEFLEIEKANLEILVTDSNPLSDIYKVSDRDQFIIREYIVYSIGNDEWPDSPPKIIIRY